MTEEEYKKKIEEWKNIMEEWKNIMEGDRNLLVVLNAKINIAIKTLELIAQDQFNGRDGEPDPMKVILRMRVEALNTLEKLK